MADQENGKKFIDHNGKDKVNWWSFQGVMKAVQNLKGFKDGGVTGKDIITVAEGRSGDIAGVHFTELRVGAATTDNKAGWTVQAQRAEGTDEITGNHVLFERQVMSGKVDAFSFGTSIYTQSSGEDWQPPSAAAISAHDARKRVSSLIDRALGRGQASHGQIEAHSKGGGDHAHH